MQVCFYISSAQVLKSRSSFKINKIQQIFQWPWSYIYQDTDADISVQHIQQVLYY